MRTICIAAAAATIAVASEATAEEAGKKPAPNEHVRFDLGVAVTNMDGAYWPTATLGVEGHLGGPVWLFTEASGTYGKWDASGYSGQSGYVDGALGARIEAPVLHWLEIGGFGMVRGGYAESADDVGTRSRSRWVGGALGLSGHFRPTRLFGVRLGLEIFRVDFQQWSLLQTSVDASGREWKSQDGGSATNVGFVPTPSLALTFTF